MFDVGFSELVLLAVIALVVLGPERLPYAARIAGAWFGRIRRTVINVQAEIEREVAESELRERIHKEMEKMKEVAASEQLRKGLADVETALKDTELSIRNSEDAHQEWLASQAPAATETTAPAVEATAPAVETATPVAETSAPLSPASDKTSNA